MATCHSGCHPQQSGLTIAKHLRKPLSCGVRTPIAARISTDASPLLLRHCYSKLMYPPALAGRSCTKTAGRDTARGKPKNLRKPKNWTNCSRFPSSSWPPLATAGSMRLLPRVAVRSFASAQQPQRPGGPGLVGRCRRWPELPGSTARGSPELFAAGMPTAERRSCDSHDKCPTALERTWCVCELFANPGHTWIPNRLLTQALNKSAPGINREVLDGIHGRG
jgi:hypothetical protein